MKLITQQTEQKLIPQTGSEQTLLDNQVKIGKIEDEKENQQIMT